MAQADIYVHSKDAKDITLLALWKFMTDWGRVETLASSLYVQTPDGEIGLAIKFNKYDWCEDDQAIQFPKDYFRFKFVLDFFADETYPEKRFHAHLQSILLHFWEKGIPAVAGGYEGEGLLHDGGYNSTEVPWPNNQHALG